jgi:dTDP-glucose 4,6-dehydratase
VYGDGKNVRDWLYVGDHVRALEAVLERGRPGETYNVGANQERTTFEVVESVCRFLESMVPREGSAYRDLIRLVPDRPGHDRRYALDAGKLKRELGWQPSQSFEDGLASTVRWYLDRREWCERASWSGYGRQRLGIISSAAGGKAG